MYKTQFICVWSAWKAGSMSLSGLLMRTHVPQLRHVLPANRFGDGQIYRRILDLIWETLTVKTQK